MQSSLTQYQTETLRILIRDTSESQPITGTNIAKRINLKQRNGVEGANMRSIIHVRLDSSNTGKHKVFVFEKMHPNSSTVTIEETVENYHRRKLQVDAYSFYRSGKDLKNRIHEHNEITGLA